MLIIDIADLSSNPAEVLDTALTDEVIVKSKDGTSYRIELFGNFSFRTTSF